MDTGDRFKPLKALQSVPKANIQSSWFETVCHINNLLRRHMKTFCGFHIAKGGNKVMTPFWGADAFSPNTFAGNVYYSQILLLVSGLFHITVGIESPCRNWNEASLIVFEG
jgi:hypothetical protein